MAEKNKKRFQVYLRADQMNALRSLSRRRGESMAELVRQGVDKIIEDALLEENPLLEIIGIFDSRVGDLSEKHDEVLARMIRVENRGCG
jgi:hypothetical protein